MGVRALADLSLSLFAEMQEQGVQPNTFSYNALLGVLARCRDMKVFDVFETMKQEMATNDPRTMIPVETVNHSVPQWMLETSDLTPLQQRPALFEDPISDQGRIGCRGVKTDLLTYTTMIQAAERMGLTERAFALFNEMKDEAGIVPDTSVFVIMMDVCVLGKDKKRAFGLFEEAKSRGTTPDIKLCNALMNVLAESGDDQVFEVFEEIRTGRIGMNVRPSQDTYNLLMKACVVSKNTERALNLYREMIGKVCPIKPDTVTYNILMDVCAINKDIETVRSLVLDMRRRDVVATITTYNKMMNVFVEAQDPGIVELFDDIRKNGPTPNLTTYCILLGFYLKKQDEAILFLFEDIRKAGVEPDIHVYNIMLSYCALAKDKKKLSLKFYDDLRTRGLLPDIDTYNALMGVLAETGDEAIFYIFKDMMENGIQPTPQTFSILGKHKKGMECLKKAGSRRLFYPR
jgi:pentatricopeptide repeat protein